MGVAPTRRVASGRGHVYYLDGTKMVGRGVTTLIGNGVPKGALQYWAARTVAEAAVHQQDQWTGMSEGQAIAFLKEAPFAERDAAARRGTEVHQLAEKLHAGEEIDVPEELEGHVDAYIQFLEDWQPDVRLVERMVVNRKHRYCGTFDSIADIAGETWLLDIKTTRSGVYPENALQLAAYRYAETCLTLDGGDEQPMPHVDRCGVIWVRADGYDLVPIDAGPAAFRFFLYAAQVADFCSDEVGKAMVLPALQPSREAA